MLQGQNKQKLQSNPYAIMTFLLIYTNFMLSFSTNSIAIHLLPSSPPEFKKFRKPAFGNKQLLHCQAGTLHLLAFLIKSSHLSHLIVSYGQLNY